MEKPLPVRCLRGLRDKNFIIRDPNGSFLYISERAYEPNEKSRDDRVSHRGKSDHYEASINWEDHLTESFQMLCADQNNAAYGIVSICLEDLKMAKANNPLAANFLDWERAVIKGNPYHGNLLFSGNLPKPKFRQLAAIIASHVDANLVFVEKEQFEAELAARSTQTTPAAESTSISLWRRFVAFVRAVFHID